MIWIILSVVYFLSAILWWNYIRIAHSKGGIWEDFKLSNDSLFYMICPLINTAFSIVGYLIFPPKGNVLTLNKFFNIKK